MKEFKPYLITLAIVIVGIYTYNHIIAPKILKTTN